MSKLTVDCVKGTCYIASLPVKESKLMFTIFTACLDVAVLPPDQGIHSVTPGPALYPAPIPAEVAGIPHLGEHGRRRGMLVRLRSVPGLYHHHKLDSH